MSWIHGPASYISSCPGNCQADPLQNTWFLAFTPYSLLHGQNPFLTNIINYPMGVNMSSNTFMPLVGLLVTPLVIVAGPTATFNVLIVAAFAGSATAAFVVFRRWTSWVGAAYAGALLYAFSPYMTAEGIAHLNLILVPIPPLILLLLDELIVRQQRSAVRSGVLLGLLMAAQFLISPEVAGTLVLMSAIGIGVLVAARWTEARRRVRYFMRGLVAAVGAFLVVNVYPLWAYFLGPERVTGSVQSRATLDLLSNDLMTLILPSSAQRISPGGLQNIADRIAPVWLWAGENGGYIGVPLLLLLIAVVIRNRKNGLVRFAGFLGIVALLISLGPKLMIDGHGTGIPLPFRLVETLPGFSSVEASRFALYVGLFAGLLLAVGLDHLRTNGFGRLGAGRPGALVATVVAVVALVSVLPAFPYPSSATGVPTFFGAGEASRIADNSVVLTYPIPDFPFVQPMNWQAVDGMRYKLIGGYIRTGDANGRALNEGMPSFTRTYFGRCEEGGDVSPSPSDVASEGNDLREWDVSTVVVTQSAPDPGCAEQLIEAVTGRPPLKTGSVWVWFGLQSDLGRT
jgi:hypothetical protein